jgi:hypothetical protein
MGNPNSNQMRAFADVVSIDAWHRGFESGCDRADLHADVVFSTARMGGEPESKVRFRLSLKRAELVVVIPETEPVKVDPTSVSRDSANLTGQRKVTTQSESGISGAAKIKASASSDSLSAEASLSADASASKKIKEETNISVDFNGFQIQHRKDRDGNYTWIIEGENGGKLNGQPWNAEEKPRLTLVDKRAHPKNNLPPVVRLEVRCLREDMEISDIEMKDEGKWSLTLTDGQKAKKLKAAEAFIRNKLEEEGLVSVAMEESFSEIVMAYITADSI